ncbi:DUF3021 family protein [Paenibacillus nanensis]|nr:DUF3021 family protein [Paenibacillus nanensis]
MRLTEYLQKMIQQFFIIFASIVLVITFLRQVYEPELPFDPQSIYVMMAFSLISAVAGLILYAPHHASERTMQIRRVLHFLAIETVLISVAAVLGIVDNVSGVITLALEIAVIYLLVLLVSWRSDKKSADQINERLKQLKKES